MKYVRLAGNNAINKTIYRCLRLISESDVPKFIKQFKSIPHDDPQVMHTFRELVLGAFLRLNGFNARHDYEVDGKTPDWVILDEFGNVFAIIELVNFHLDRLTEKSVTHTMDSGQTACVWTDNTSRLYQTVWKKSDTYEKIAVKNSVPYVVAIFGEFTAGVDFDEIQEVLFEEHGGLFSFCQILSGVLFFEESGGQYVFKYFANPKPLQGIELPIGVF
jgi:hypothetical protein